MRELRKPLYNFLKDSQWRPEGPAFALLWIAARHPRIEDEQDGDERAAGRDRVGKQRNGAITGQALRHDARADHGGNQERCSERLCNEAALLRHHVHVLGPVEVVRMEVCGDVLTVHTSSDRTTCAAWHGRRAARVQRRRSW